MYNIELVPARLTPFDWTSLSGNIDAGALPINNDNISGHQQTGADDALTSNEEADVFASIALSGFYPTISASGQFNVGGLSVALGSGVGSTGLSTSGSSIYPSSHPLYPLTQTGGLVFPYNPVISESIGVKYDVTEMVHTNENVHAYKNTDNIRITLSDCVWTSETFDRAIYTLAVIHFFRSYRLMDFGRGTNRVGGQRGAGTGRPPSPMWFSAYGDFMYHLVPVLIERADYTFPADIDYVGVPNPGTDAYDNQQLTFASGRSSNFAIGTQADGYTWIPIKFAIGSISMVVQHSIKYWTQQFNLDDFKAGLLVGR